MHSLFCLFFAILPFWSKADVSTDLIQAINQKNTTWIAGRNFPEDTPVEKLKHLAGLLRDHRDAKNFKPIPEAPYIEDIVIPENFDARTKWPACNDVMSKIRDQGNCGACWAFATAEVMTDRVCIATNGFVKFEFSPNDLLSCCENCGDCDGGYTTNAWLYWTQKGVVSGGDYNSQQGCKPYAKSAYHDNLTPNCTNTCDNPDYKIPYSDDKYVGSNFYFVPANETRIQAEIMTNGPVQASYEVYEDFYYYQSGVYQHVEGAFDGYHAVKILGWGVEKNGVPYWLVANSWGSDWGSLGGFFKILRGRNECDIETDVFTGSSSFRYTGSGFVIFANVLFSILYIFKMY